MSDRPAVTTGTTMTSLLLVDAVILSLGISEIYHWKWTLLDIGGHWTLCLLTFVREYEYCNHFTITMGFRIGVKYILLNIKNSLIMQLLITVSNF
jgi:hypothetical protein